LTNYPAHVEAPKTNLDLNTQNTLADVNPLVAAAPHYMAQGNNWLLWLLVLLIALFLLVLEIRRRMDASAKRRARMGPVRD
jgi:hypothetical protein